MFYHMIGYAIRVFATDIVPSGNPPFPHELWCDMAWDRFEESTYLLDEDPSINVSSDMISCRFFYRDGNRLSAALRYVDTLHVLPWDYYCEWSDLDPDLDRCIIVGINIDPTNERILGQLQDMDFMKRLKRGLEICWKTITHSQISAPKELSEIFLHDMTVPNE
jgi:hypothetical protein